MKRTCLVFAMALSLTAFIGCDGGNCKFGSNSSDDNISVNANANDVPGNPDATIADQGQDSKKKSDKPAAPAVNQDDDKTQIQKQNVGKVDPPATQKQDDVIKPDVKVDNSDVKTF